MRAQSAPSQFLRTSVKSPTYSGKGDPHVTRIVVCRACAFFGQFRGGGWHRCASAAIHCRHRRNEPARCICFSAENRGHKNPTNSLKPLSPPCPANPGGQPPPSVSLADGSAKCGAC